MGRLLPYTQQRMSRTHRRGRRPRRPFRRMTDDVGSTRQPTSAPAPMVRGLRPRDCIRWVVDVTGRAAENAVKIGHAERPRLTKPGNTATTGRRGRRPLRAGGKPRYPHRGKQARKRPKCPPTLGSPERGAVAAHCAVTEGLGRRGWGVPTLSVNQRRAGVEDKPLRGVGRWGCRMEPASSVDRRRRTEDGAPYGVWGTFPHCKYVICHPTEGASGTPPPTAVAIGYVFAEP